MNNVYHANIDGLDSTLETLEMHSLHFYLSDEDPASRLLTSD